MSSSTSSAMSRSKVKVITRWQLSSFEETETQRNRRGQPSNNGRKLLADLGNHTLNWTEQQKSKDLFLPDMPRSAVYSWRSKTSVWTCLVTWLENLCKGRVHFSPVCCSIKMFTSFVRTAIKSPDKAKLKSITHEAILKPMLLRLMHREKVTVSKIQNSLL